MEYNTDYFLDTANGYTVTLIENGNRSYNKPTFRSKMAANEYALKLFNEKNTTRYFVERSMNDGLYHFSWYNAYSKNEICIEATRIDDRYHSAFFISQLQESSAKNIKKNTQIQIACKLREKGMPVKEIAEVVEEDTDVVRCWVKGVKRTVNTPKKRKPTKKEILNGKEETQ